MPISTRQLDANRANAKKSTGPRSPAGKAATAKNATTHGLSSRRFIVEPHQQQDFDDFQTNLRAEVQPLGALEIDSFQQLLHAAWQLRRADALDADLHDAAASPATRLDQLERITRLRATLERSYQRAFRRLRELQTIRAAERAISHSTALSHSVLTPLAPPPKPPKSPPPNQTHFDDPSPLNQWVETVGTTTGSLPVLPLRALLHLYARLKISETAPQDPTKPPEQPQEPPKSDNLRPPPSDSLKDKGSRSTI